MDVNRMNACADRYEVEVQCIYRVLRQFRNCGHGPSSQCACDCKACRPSGDEENCVLPALPVKLKEWLKDWLCEPQYCEIVPTETDANVVRKGIGGKWSTLCCARARTPSSENQSRAKLGK
jgi:hypothetical protein